MNPFSMNRGERVCFWFGFQLGMASAFAVLFALSLVMQ